MILGNDIGVISHFVLAQSGGDRISFDLMLPCDCLQVTGIVTQARPSLAAFNALKSDTFPHTIAGNLSLRWNRPGDIFYQSKVDWDKTFEMDYSPAQITHPAGNLPTTGWLSTSGRRIEEMAINVPGDLRLIQGYYKDVINQQTSTNETYVVIIYLYYKKKA